MNKPTITNLFIKPGSGEPMQPVEALEAVAGKGLKGDNAYGRSSRQVLLVDQQIIDELELVPGALRENITVVDLDVDALEPGTYLAIGSTLLEITKVCEPCWKMDRIRPGLKTDLEGQRGVLANVVISGRIVRGDTIAIRPDSTS